MTTRFRRILEQCARRLLATIGTLAGDAQQLLPHRQGFVLDRSAGMIFRRHRRAGTRDAVAATGIASQKPVTTRSPPAVRNVARLHVAKWPYYCSDKLHECAPFAKSSRALSRGQVRARRVSVLHHVYCYADRVRVARSGAPPRAHRPTESLGVSASRRKELRPSEIACAADRTDRPHDIGVDNSMQPRAGQMGRHSRPPFRLSRRPTHVPARHRDDGLPSCPGQRP